MSFNAGEQVGPYRILEQLGQGGMATVYKAYHASLDRYVAIKVLHHAFLEDANFLARFQREARVVAKLEHPNIVPIYDYAEHGNRPYLVMKYIEGDTLKARLKRGPLTASEVSFIIESVGAALAYAHKQGILHRDVKPSNVINANEGQIYLADFGLARIAQAGESTLTSDAVLGTPQYISPEQAMGKKDLDDGTDIYSFGAMIYEMTVGRVPFSSDTPFSVIHDHIYTPLPLPSSVNPGISPTLERFLLKSLAKERADRFVDVASMVTAFKEAWTSSDSTLALSSSIPAPETGSASPATASSPMTVPVQPQGMPPVAPPVAVPQKPAPNRKLWLAATIIPLCLCCVIGFLLLRSSNRDEPPPLPRGLEPTIEAIFEGPLTPDIAEIPDAEITPLGEISLEAAQQLAENKPRDPKARMLYGFALLNDGQEAGGYAEIKKGVDLAGKNQIVLLAAAKSFEEQESWLAAAIVYVQIAENARVMPPARWDAIRSAIYYGFRQEIAPEVLSYARLKKVDESLALIAEASYIISYADSDEPVQALLDQLETIQPGLGEAKLLQAQKLIDENRESDAKPLLQALIDAPDMSAWVKDEAETILEEIE